MDGSNEAVRVFGFTYEKALQVTYPILPFKWIKHSLTVIADGYLESGVRVHIVEEDKHPVAVMLSNAIVISRR